MNKHPFIPAVRDLAEKLPELQAIRRITVRKEKKKGCLSGLAGYNRPR